MTKKLKWVFFGSSEFSVYILGELKTHDTLPGLIITTPDKPKGRRLVLTPTPVKVWAQKNGIEVIDPPSLKKDSDKLISKLKVNSYELFLVASYGKIIPKEIFEIPEYKTLNIHPSLLPKYRGASPIQSQILNDEKDVGVSIMQIEETMDTGPVVIQRQLEIRNPKSEIRNRKELEKESAIMGAQLFAQVLPKWLEGKIKPEIQDEKEATYCQKIKKEDGELQIDLNNMPTGGEARNDLLKIKAFEEWPTTYFFLERNDKKIRVIITDAKLKTDGSTGSPQAKLEILKVIPEGKKEMPFDDFLRGQK
ncbi:MAG: methionyl-tRNA formyltransferase [Candidatus Nealsonbacteria bacterium RIFOXYD1_FULL_39_11]|nr:MAG: methionyl-tRNA formyltransferase [Candidatus Nealsonbacteria bacterium RIFOXYD1_FULL_39_11]